jgi:DNA (cytosine-5)-methyltransferase 1
MEAASVAWEPLGWKPVAFSEIEAFPSAILKHHFSQPNYPYDVPNLGSLTEYTSWPLEPGAIDLLVGGTPCQSFSVAGLRKGLTDPRGNLALTFLGLADKLKPRWIVWENVPGVLSSAGGRDFGSFLGALVELGYGFAYRVLDAQHFGVPQRRRRVFVVACLGDWRAAAEVLSLREGLRGYLETGNKKRKSPTADAGASVEAGGSIGGIDYEHNAHGPNDVTGPLLKVSPTGGAHPLPAIAFRKSKRACSTTDNESLVLADSANTLNNFDLGDTRTTHVAHPVVPLDGMNLLSRLGECGESHSMQNFEHGDPSFTLRKGGQQHGVLTPMAVRRLTPVECERLQGFPDNWSRISWKGKPESECPDGPRYKACGNSMAVPCMFWIGERIAAKEGKPSV